MYNYGTAGFRYNSKIILEIANKIAVGCVQLLVDNKKYNNFLAIMITASHNPEADNGVKIVDKNGNMLDNEDEKKLENIVNNLDNHLELLQKIKPNVKIVIGRDTRNSGQSISDELARGFHLVSSPDILDLGYVTTPQLHFYASTCGDLENNSYLNKLKENKISNLLVDCAGGVGGIVAGDLKLNAINLPFNNNLNEGCGSDFVLTNNCPPKGYKLKEGEFGCSLDGDADRLIFWYQNKTGFHVLDGDAQMVLWAMFLKTKFPEVVAITTPYCNGNTVKFLESNDIKVILKPTGIKNLHEEAIQHNVAVYFENNGHGTGHWPEITLKNGKKLVVNSMIGDGIYNIYTTLQILGEMGMTMEECDIMYEKLPVRQWKIPKDKLPDLEVEGVECKLIKPLWLKQLLDDNLEKYGGRVFLRKSGTEPIIRVYAESANINELYNSLKFSL